MLTTRSKYITAYALLAGLLLIFAHSELGLMTCSGDLDHNDHDFCLLTKVLHEKDQSSSGLQILQIAPLPQSTACIISQDILSAPVLSRQITGSNFSQYRDCGADLFLVNRTLLI
jgi:hypothetical protein